MLRLFFDRKSGGRKGEAYFKQAGENETAGWGRLGEAYFKQAEANEEQTGKRATEKHLQTKKVS